MDKREIPDWNDINEPWWQVNGFLELLLDKVSVRDVLDKYGLDYIRTSSGNFDYKMKCPFTSHQGGNERTPSLHISDKTNSFYCFGCHEHGGPLQFLVKYKDIPYQIAIEELSKIGGLTNGDITSINTPLKVESNPKHAIMPHIFSAGVSVRDFLKSIEGHESYRDFEIWANEQFRTMDKMLSELSDEDWLRAKKYKNKVRAFLRSKREVL